MRTAIEAGAVFRAAVPEPFLDGFLSYYNPRSYGITPDEARILTLQSVQARQPLRVVAYSDDWLARARRLLGQRP